MSVRRHRTHPRGRVDAAHHGARGAADQVRRLTTREKDYYLSADYADYTDFITKHFSEGICVICEICGCGESVVRFLAVADIHSRTAAIQAVQDGVSQHAPDAVIVAGDLTNYGDAAEVTRVLEDIPGRVLAIPGNLDVRRAFEAGTRQSHAESVIGKRIEIGGVIIAGLFDGLAACDILVVHEPPRGILDDVGGGRHIGFAEHLDALNRLRPKVLLCGHCHESPGVVVHGGTTVVNCTLGSGGRGALVELDSHQAVARLL